jgi:hypothetical protein
MSSLDMSQLAGLGNPPGMAFAAPGARGGGLVRATQARGYVQPGTRARPRPTRAPVRVTRPRATQVRQPTRVRTVTRRRAQPVTRAPRAQPTPRPTPVPRTRTRTIRRSRPQPVKPRPPQPPRRSLWDRTSDWAAERARLAYNEVARSYIRRKRDEALRAPPRVKQAAVRRAYGKQAADLFGRLTKSEQDSLYSSGVQSAYSAALTKHVKRRRRRTR